MLRYRDLLRVPHVQPTPFLLCPTCRREFTAHPGEYAIVAAAAPVRCVCGVPLDLVTRRIVLEHVPLEPKE